MAKEQADQRPEAIRQQAEELAAQLRRDAYDVRGGYGFATPTVRERLIAFALSQRQQQRERIIQRIDASDLPGKEDMRNWLLAEADAQTEG